MKKIATFLLSLFPAILFAQDAGGVPKGFSPFFFPVSAFSDNVSIAGKHFKFDQEKVEYNIESCLKNILTFREEFKAAGSKQESQSAQAYLDRSYLNLAYNIIAAEQFGTKNDKLLALLREVDGKLKDEPLPRRVVTPRQLYLAIGQRSFTNIEGLPMELGEISDLLTFGDLVIEARDQLLYRSGESKQ